MLQLQWKCYTVSQQLKICLHRSKKSVPRYKKHCYIVHLAEILYHCSGKYSVTNITLAEIQPHCINMQQKTMLHYLSVQWKHCYENIVKYHWSRKQLLIVTQLNCSGNTVTLQQKYCYCIKVVKKVYSGVETLLHSTAVLKISLQY